MNRTELVRLVDMYRAAWPSRDSNDRQDAAVVRTWWRYLQDLPFDDVVRELDSHVVRGGWPPRVGEIRRAVVLRGSRAETPAEAWASVQERLRAVETGTEWNELTEEAAEAMRRSGMDGRSRPDERSFRAAYEDVCAARDSILLAVADPEPFGEVPR